MTPLHQLSRRLPILVCAVLAVTAMSNPVQAQIGAAGELFDAMQKTVYPRDLPFIAKHLDLDEGQRFIVETLLENYDADFKAGIDELVETLKDSKDELDSADQRHVLKIVFGPVDDWRREKVELERRFMEELRLQLNDNQEPLWEPFHRRWLRYKIMDKGKLDGESTDLIEVLEETAPGETFPEAAPIIEEYAIRLHDALLARQRYIQDSQADIIDSMMNSDPNQGLEAVQRQVQYRVAVRDVNEEYRLKIAEALPSPTDEEFRVAALRDAYPAVYRPTKADRMFDKAFELEDLTEGQRAALTDLFAEYEAFMSDYNRSLVEQVKVLNPEEVRRENELAAERMATGASARGRQRGPNELRELYRERDKQAEPFLARLEALLNPDQYAQLPGAMRRAKSPAELDQERDRIRRRAERGEDDQDS